MLRLASLSFVLAAAVLFFGGVQVSCGAPASNHAAPPRDTRRGGDTYPAYVAVAAPGVASPSAPPAGSAPAPPGAPEEADDAPASTYLRDVLQLSVGKAHVCALTASRRVVCWGDNAAGQLGVDTRGRAVAGSVTRPHRVGGLPASTAQVAAGFAHTCARDRDGAVYCWGSAGGDLVATEGGVAGSIELQGRALGTPVRMALGAGAAHLVALSNRESAACAAFDDDVRCWSTFGALPIDPSVAPAPLAGTTTPIAGVTALAVGHGDVCAIARDALWCWHSGTKNKPAQPTLAARGRGDSSAPARVAIGEQQACVATVSGELRCWTSLIGDFWKKPPNVEVRWPKKTPTLAVAVGDSPVCTVDRDGGVDCFLAAEGGLTEQALARSWATRAMAPHPIAGLSGAVDLGLGAGRNVFGYGFGCALRSAADAAGAQVLCWGDNDSGQLGTGDTVTSVRTAVRVLGAR